MKEKLVTEIVQGMLGSLNNEQLGRLQEVLEHCFFNIEVIEEVVPQDPTEENDKLLDSFIAAKRIEGCSEKSLNYYKTTIGVMMVKVNKPVQ